MSFEAVPCMFKSRQEDGNEAQLFGLLIRPSSSTTTTQQQQQQSSAPPPGSLPIATLSAGPSSIQLVPTSSSVASSSCDVIAPKKASTKDGRAASRCGGSTLFHANTSSTSNGITSSTALFTSAPNGMPPILPRRTKNGKTMARLNQQQQLVRSLVQLPTKAATLAFEMAQPSSSQIGAQLGASATFSLEGCELSVSTTTAPSSSGCSFSSAVRPSHDSPSPSCSTPSNNNKKNNNTNGLLAIHSPPQKTQLQNNATGEKPTTPSIKTPRRRKSRQTLAPEGEQGKGNGGGTTETDSGAGSTDLLGDLHSIEYSQLVNSSVITTEDYLPNQSDPIYTNMDMYSSSSLGVQQQQQNKDEPQQKQRAVDIVEKNALSSAGAVASSLCPAAIFVHNQQHHHQQQHFPTQSSVPSSVRFIPNGGSAGVTLPTPAVVVPPPPPQQAQQHAAHWHPYMGAHPGGPSHISSTPDSGIQSIDGSPPSVYTPPMVSPYASQVRSCESVTNGVPNGMPSSSSSTICAVVGLAANASSSGTAFYGTSTFSSSNTEESLTITTLNPSSASASSIFLTSSSSLNVHPSLIIEQMAEGQNDGAETAQRAEEEEDFSDMPKLVPVTHTEHDEDVAPEDDHVLGPMPATSAESLAEASTDDGKRAAPLFHQGMSLHELAECLSSNISPEQLKQLTSLIQRKAEEQKNNLDGGGGHERRGQRKDETKEQKGEGEEEVEEEQEHQQHHHQEQNGRAKRDRQQGMTNSRKEGEGEEAGKEGQGEAGGGGQGEEAEQDGGTESEAARRARDIEQLAIYRARVRQQLERKLTALLERVIRRMDKCHLNLPSATETAQHREWPWKRMDWEEIHRRAEERGERWMIPTTTTEEEDKKKKGRKRKSAKGGEWGDEEMCARRRAEEKKRGDGESSEREAKRERKVLAIEEKEESGEDDQLKNKIGRKRRRKEMDEKQQGETIERNEKPEGHGREEKQTKRVRAQRRERNERPKEHEREEKQTKRVRTERREWDEKPEEHEREKKQSTPKIILRIRPLPSPAVKASALTTIKKLTAKKATTDRSLERVHSHATNAKRKPSASPKPSCSSSSSDPFLRERCHSSATLFTNDGGRNCAIGGRRWTTTTGKRTKGRGTPTTGAKEEQQNGISRRARRRETVPNPEHLLSDRERAIVHSKGCFLIRNLSRRRRIRGPTTQCQTVDDAPTRELVKILEHALTQFCCLFDRRFVSDRQMGELIRTVKLLFSSVHDPSTLLTRFDALLTQFAVSAVSDESVLAQFVRLKQSIDFGKAKQSLQKDALSVFFEEGSNRLRSPSLSSSSNRRDTFHRPLTVDTCIDLSYLDSAHPVGQWDPDKAAKLSPTSDNRDHDCVRCICGIAEDDGVMSQCDRCHFWLHADCLDCPVLDDHQEFVCDFCTRRIETTPQVDIVLKPQPTIKLSGCTYYRTLVSSRGLQVRLNESVYVERLINDKHKGILRELHEECVRKQQLAYSAQQSPQKRGRCSVGKRGNSGGKTGEQQQRDEGGERAEKRATNRWWPEDNSNSQQQVDDSQMPSTSAGGKTALALSDNGTTISNTTPTPIGNNDGKQCTQFHRRDLRVFRIERLFCSPNGQRFIFGCYYARPHETFCDSSRMFYRNELFWTPLFDTLPLDSVVGRCLVLEPQIWAMGRPKSPRYLEDDVFVCEYQIDRNQRSFEKIPPKNRYYINTEPYVFNVFENKLTMRRDFTPFKVTGSISSDPKMAALSTANTNGTNAPPMPPPASSSLFNNALVRRQVLQQHLDSVCSMLSVRSCFGSSFG